MDAIGELAGQAAKEVTELGLKTRKQIKSHIFNELWRDYKGKAPKWRVEAVAGDITESVCLLLSIPRD